MSAILLQWIRRFASSPNSWVSFLVYWFNLRLGHSPVQVFANPPVFDVNLPPFYVSLLRAWRLAAGSASPSGVLYVGRGVVCAQVSATTTKSTYLMLLADHAVSLHCEEKSFLSLVRFIGLLLGVSCSCLISIAPSLICLGRLPMGSSTLPSVCPLLDMICRLFVSVVAIWSLWTIFSFIVRWLLVFSHGFNRYFSVPLLWPLPSCVAMRYSVSRRMSSVLFLSSLSMLSMLVNSTFGWLVMIFGFGMPLLVRSMSLRVSNVVSLFTYLCSFAVFAPLGDVVTLSVSGVLVALLLPSRMGIFLSTSSVFLLLWSPLLVALIASLFE